MGTRINVMFGSGEDISCVLYSNSSHEDVDAEKIVRTIIEATEPGVRGCQLMTSVVEQLLQLRYMTNGGLHKRGERVFILDQEPGDCEFILMVSYDHESHKLRVDKQYTF